MVDLSQFKKEIETAQEGSRLTQVPSGDYVVACVSTENKQNSKRNGHYIQNEYEIQEGEFVGVKLIDRINHDNPNEMARKIAFATIKALGTAIGKKEPLASTEELIGKKIVATVKNEESNRPMEDDNGDQRVDSDGKPLFYRNINITKYKPYKAATTTHAPSSSGGSFPFPR